MSVDPRLKALSVTCQNVLAAASNDPVLAERVLRRLRADPKLTDLVVMPPGIKRTGRRTPAKIDPFKILTEGGEHALTARLSELDQEELRDVVAQYGMDPRRLVMKWKDPERLREHIVVTTIQRSQKGDAFRT